VDFYDDPDFPAALLRIEPDQLRTSPPSPRLTSAPSNRQLAADGLPVRAPRFKLVHARHDPYLGPGCPALVGKPAGFRQAHHSDDELGPAISFTAKFKCFHETSEQFSSRVSRAYFAGELSEHAVDSLREDIPTLTFLERLSRHCREDPSVPFEPRGLVRIHKQLVRAAGLPEDTDFNSETTQQGLTDRQREIARTLTERDSSLPPGMFRHAEFNALRALVAQRDAVRGVSRDATGRSTEDRELDDIIDEQLTANAWERYTGSEDGGGGGEVIEDFGVSDDELADTVLRIRDALRVPAVAGSHAAPPTRLQPTAASRDPQMLGRLERRLRRERRALQSALAIGSVSDVLAATGNVSDVMDAIGGIDRHACGFWRDRYTPGPAGHTTAYATCSRTR
jgi:hypothetical protein